jgi:hypothetical protein
MHDWDSRESDVRAGAEDRDTYAAQIDSVVSALVAGHPLIGEVDHLLFDDEDTGFDLACAGGLVVHF